MKYIVVKIEEDLDFGCEERGEDTQIMAVVTLQDELGKVNVRKFVDQDLYDSNILEGDLVTIWSDGKLIKIS